MPELLHLPSEMLLETASYLPEKSFNNLRATCTFFRNRLHDDLLKRIDRRKIIQVAASGFYSLFLRQDGRVLMSGELSNNLDFDGETQFQRTMLAPSLFLLDDLTNVARMFAGKNHMVFIKKDGSVYALGKNHDGRLGVGHDEHCYTPTPVVELSAKVIDVAMGLDFTIYLKSDGIPYICGKNDCGQLGLGELGYGIVTPTPIPALTDIIAVAANPAFRCGHKLFLKNNGTVLSYGSNELGERGWEEEETNTSYFPQTTSDLNQIVRISAGGQHSVFISKENQVFLCGDYYDTVNVSEENYFPRLFPQIENVITAASSFHSILLTKNHSVYIVGSNSYHQHGQEYNDGLQGFSFLPYLNDICGVAAGETHSLLLSTDGTVRGCGKNEQNQLPLNTPESEQQETFTILESLTRYKDLAKQLGKKEEPVFCEQRKRKLT